MKMNTERQTQRCKGNAGKEIGLEKMAKTLN